jgi:dephospho-CoA kinase
MKKGFKRGEIIKRIKSQVSLREKERHADYIIVNAGSVADTKRQAEKIWNDIVACKHL